MLALCCLLFLNNLDIEAAPLAGAAQEWHQYLGPKMNASSDEVDLVEKWPETGPKILWQINIGKGFSGFVTKGSRIFTMMAEQRETAVALDRTSGEILWQVRTGDVFRDSQGGDGPRATPTVDGDYVFFCGAYGNLFCLEAATGHLVWKRNIVEDFGGRLPAWGFSPSPIIDGDHLLISTGGISTPSLIALDKLSGQIIWQKRPSKAGYATPFPSRFLKKQQYLFFTGTELVSLDPKTGALLWAYDWHTPWQANSANPVRIDEERLLISSGYGQGAAMLRVLHNEEKRLGVDVIWRSKNLASAFTTPVAHNGQIYGFSGSLFRCIDAEDGRIRWQRRGFGRGSVLYADGKLIILSEWGQLSLVKADPNSYRSLATAEVISGKCWTMPSLSKGVLYIRNQNSALAIDLKQGK